MPSITQRGNTYRFAVSCGYSSDGKKIVKTTTWTPLDGLTPKQLEKAKQQAATEFETKVKNGQYMDGNISLSEFVKKWLAEYAVTQLSSKTLESYNCELNTKILPALGHIKVGKLQPVNILSFLNNLLEDGCRVDGRAGAYSNRTVKYQHSILSSILQTAVYWQIIPSNPCERVRVPKIDTTGEEKQIKFFTDDQCIRFLEATQKEEVKYQAIAAIAIYGGLRRGEILGLTWADIDLDSGMININRSNSYLSGKGVVTKAPKTAQSRRSILLPESVMVILRKHRQEQSEARLKLGELWQNNGLLFTQWNGKPMFPSTPRHWMWDVIEKYNMRLANDGHLSDQDKSALMLPYIPFHGLRHTSATLLIAGNTDASTVAARLGHAQTSTTMNIYSHALKSLDKTAATTLNNMLGNKKIKQESRLE